MCTSDPINVVFYLFDPLLPIPFLLSGFKARVYEIQMRADFHIHGCTRLGGQISKVIWTKSSDDDDHDNDDDGGVAVVDDDGDVDTRTRSRSGNQISNVCGCRCRQ